MNSTSPVPIQAQVTTPQPTSIGAQSFKEALLEILVSSWNVLSATIWPLQLGVLTAIIGLIISVVTSVYALPNIPTKDGVAGSIDLSSDVYIEKDKLYALLNLATNFLVFILSGMLLNLYRSVWRWKQHYNATRSGPAQLTGKQSKVELAITTLLDLLCATVPCLIIYESIRGLRLTRLSMFEEMHLQPVQASPDPIVIFVSWAASHFKRDPLLFTAIAVVLLTIVFLGLFTVRVWKRTKIASVSSP